MTLPPGAVVLVTGASRGIGRATALLLAQRGATVVGVGRDAAALAELERSAGVTPVAADLTDARAAARVVHHVTSVHDRLDAVVSCAGVGHAGPVATMDAESITRLVDLNVRAPMLLARAALPALLSRGGALVFVTSIAGLVGVPGESVYSATKAATEAFAGLLREELHGSRVRVSTVAPGVVDTGFFSARGAPYDRRFPRPVQPERIAAAIAAAIDTGIPRQVVPRWLGVPARLSQALPQVYRGLARRFG